MSGITGINGGTTVLHTRGDGEHPLAIVVLAAGLGTRMRSATAKVLHRVGDRPLIAYVVDTALQLAPERLVVVVGHQAELVDRACRSRVTNGTIHFARQVEQRGTGDAVRAAVPALAGFSGDVLIIYGDVPALRAETLGSFVAGHVEAAAELSLLTACFPDPTGYGRIIRSPSGEIERIVEERDAAPEERRIREVNTGIYCVDAALLLAAVQSLAADNSQGEYYLTDIVSAARTRGRRLWSRQLEDLGEVRGINTRAELADMEASVRQTIVDRWMADGVTFEDPATAYIGADVAIGRDTTIGPNVHLRGATVIGEGCRIDGTAYLDNARLGAGVHLKFGVVVADSIIGDRAEIGPFAHLRPGTDLAARVRIGNFVETKKATLGTGTKANHLTYLGDVTIGEDTNIGAGTITCNYDGFRKHPTIIGDRVQIGSDTQLVAPVEVGSDAYVGAGTTVTRPVPPGTLVVSRTPQRHVAGWVGRRRAKEAEGGAGGGGPRSAKAKPSGRAGRGAQQPQRKRVSKQRPKTAARKTVARKPARPAKPARRRAGHARTSRRGRPRR